MDKRVDSFFLPRKNKRLTNSKENLSYHQNARKDKRKNIPDEENKQKEDSQGTHKTKKPFDKKSYRFKKYSNKYKLDQWHDKRKQIMLKKYHKQLKKEHIEFSTVEQDGAGKFVKHPDKLEKTDENTKITPSNKKPINRFEQMKLEKLQKRQEIERVKEERKQKLLEYKKKKLETYKKLNKKTKKGQPVMTGRLELLLEKIQNK